MRKTAKAATATAVPEDDEYSPDYRTIGTILANYDDGEGKVELTPGFKRADALLRLDVLKDCIGDLQAAYDQAHEKFFPGYQAELEAQVRVANKSTADALRDVVGKTIRSTEVLPDGALKLEFSDGSIAVMHGGHESPVRACAYPDASVLTNTVAMMQKRFGDRYTTMPTAKDTAPRTAPAYN